MKSALITLALTLLSTAGAVAADSTLKPILNLPYGKQPLQKLDIYPAKKVAGDRGKLSPVLVFVHGGGWRRGDKAHRADKGAAFAAHGVTLVSLDYRLAPQVMHPSQVQDVALALRYIKDNIARAGGDPERIYISGHSAGAHLVCLLATNDKYIKAQKMNLGDIKGVVSLDTACMDLRVQGRQNPAEARFLQRLIGQAFGHDPLVLQEASPACNIISGKKYPPFLLVGGSGRFDVTRAHRDFKKALEATGGRCEILSVPMTHADIHEALSDDKSEIFKAVYKFI